MVETFSIDTPRLRLRPLSLEDVDQLLVYHSDPRVVRYIPWPERARAQVIEAVEDYPAPPFVLNEVKDSVVLGWVLKDTGAIVGQSNLSLLSKVNQTIDVGWVTHPKYWRQGLAFEATEAFIGWAFENFDVHRVVANIDVRNPESARLAEKLGMRLEAHQLQSVFTKGEWCDMWQYACLRSELPRRLGG